MNGNSDSKLVASARAGDRDAFGALVERWRAMATGMAVRMLRNPDTAREVVHEATVQAYLSLDRLRDEARFGSWMCGIVLNLCRERIRERSKAPVSLESISGAEGLDELLLSQSASPDPAALVEERELRDLLLGAVRELSPVNRNAALLFYYQQLTVREIADSLGISVGAVKVRLNRARNALKGRLGTESRAKSVPLKRHRREVQMVRVTVADVLEQAATDAGARHVVILQDEARRRMLPIWIGKSESVAIALGLRKVATGRPMTFSFITDLLEAAGTQVEEVRIERLEGDTFYAVVRLSTGGAIKEVDSRPSDAIALAVRTNSPITVAESVMDRSGMDIPPSASASGANGADALLRELETWLRPRKLGQQAGEEEKGRDYRELTRLVFGQEP